MYFHNDRLEARVGIEPTYKGFADLSLTTWVPRLQASVYRILRLDSARIQTSRSRLHNSLGNRAQTLPDMQFVRNPRLHWLHRLHDHPHHRIERTRAQSPRRH